MVRLMSFFVVAALMTGCGPSSTQYESLKSENQSLRAEIAQLKEQIEAPPRLLAAGKLNFDKANYEIATKHLGELVNKHPESAEAAEAGELLPKAKAGLEKQRAEKKAASEREAQEKERRLARATKAMKKKVDELEGITWYTDSSTPSSESSFHIYFGKKTGIPWLRLVTRYYGSDWLFVQSFFVVADGQRFEYPQTDFKQDHHTSVWEWRDAMVEDRDMVMIKAVIASKKATIRFVGRQYYKDHVISADEKKALERVLDAFAAMGGTV